MADPPGNSISTPLASPGRTGPAERTRAPRRPRRWVPYAIGAALLLGIVAGLWPQPDRVETAKATIGPLRATVNEEGKTRIKQRFTVSAPVAGHLRRIPLKPGAEVQGGYTVVAVLDPISPALLDARSRAQAEAKRDAAQANLEKATAAHDFALSELRRYEKLFAEQAVSVQELEPVQWRETSTARDQAAAESDLRQAEAELAVFNPSTRTKTERVPTEVIAPANGRVLRVFEESSRVVAAGTPLMEMGDPADLEAVIEVLSRDGAAIAPGTKVELEQWGGGPPLQARVRLVEPAAFTKVSALGVEEQRVNVIADILTPPPQRLSLGDNFRVEARIIMWETDQALKVPSGALFRRGDHWAAFVLEGSRARLRLVKVGRSSGTETQVLEGLKAGEEVILYPGDRVRDGQKVKSITI
jgi:HlyD family secretion protein